MALIRVVGANIREYGSDALRQAGAERRATTEHRLVQTRDFAIISSRLPNGSAV
jgi:hypothetical protein